MADTFPAVQSRAVRLAFAAALAVIPVLLLAGYILMQAFGREDAMRDALNQSFLTRTQTQKVLSLLQDAETGQRGYMITGDDAFLGPYLVATNEIPDALSELEALVDTAQAGRMKALRRVTDAKMAELKLTIAMRREGRTEEGLARIRTSIGRRLMDEARMTIAAIEGHEVALLEHRVDEARRARRGTELLTGGLFIFLALLVLGAGISILRTLREREAISLRLQEAAARHQAVFDSAVDSIITLNPSGSIETINRAGERTFGRKAADLERRDLGVVIELPSKGEGAFLKRIGLTGENLRDGVVIEGMGRRADGSTFPVDVAFGSMRLSRGLHVVAVVRDISERKRIEQLKDEFISTVSHELRTPLTSIAGSLGLLKGGAAGPLEERADRLITIAHKNCERLVRLINDILDIQKIESGKMRFAEAELDLIQVVHQAVEGLRGYTGKLGIEVVVAEPEAPLMVRGDADRLTQVASNLIANATRFSPAGKPVEVSFTVDGDTIRTSVRDHGPGVPEAFRSRIFSKFAQADGSSTREDGGTGLGLAISKEITDRHGGKLWFESETGKGAVFHIDLPVLTPRAPRVIEGVSTFLICESDPQAGALLQALLEAEGVRTELVTDLNTAETVISERTYAGLFLDLNLPDGHGLDLLKRLRLQGDNRALPVVVVSLEAPSPDDLKGAAVEIVDWIAKPLDSARIRSAIETVIQRSRHDGPLILHVDDDPDVLHLVGEALGDAGEVIRAQSVIEARAILAARRPDLVILDLGLPDGSGLELLPLLKGADGEAIPVIVFSAQELEDSAFESVDEVLTKSRTTLDHLAALARKLSAGRDENDA
jgi:PAS domain S-box-containing protein